MDSDTLSRHAQFVGQKSESPSRALSRANSPNMKADAKSFRKLNVKLSIRIDHTLWAGSLQQMEMEPK
jgi:hypothetical protein